MKKKVFLFTGVFLALAALIFLALSVLHPDQGMRPPLLFHEGTLYRISADSSRIAPEEVENGGYAWYEILSVVKGADAPQTHGQANSGKVGQAYAFDRESRRIYLRIERNGRRWYVSYLPLEEWAEEERQRFPDRALLIAKCAPKWRAFSTIAGSGIGGLG